MNPENSDKSMNQPTKPEDGSTALQPPVVIGSSPSAIFLRARMAEGMGVTEARAAMKEWQAENAPKPEPELETPLEPKIIRTTEKSHPIYHSILDLMQQRLDESGRVPSQTLIALALNKSQAWISRQMIGMEVSGLIKKIPSGRGYRIVGRMKRQIPSMGISFVEVWGEDMAVPAPSHWIQGSCFLFKPEAGHLRPAIVEAGITSGCWVMIQKQSVAEDFDIVAHYDESWGLRLMEYGPAMMGKIEGKVIQVFKDHDKEIENVR